MSDRKGAGCTSFTVSEASQTFEELLQCWDINEHRRWRGRGRGGRPAARMCTKLHAAPKALSTRPHSHSLVLAPSMNTFTGLFLSDACYCTAYIKLLTLFFFFFKDVSNKACAAGRAWMARQDNKMHFVKSYGNWCWQLCWQTGCQPLKAGCGGSWCRNCQPQFLGATPGQSLALCTALNLQPTHTACTRTTRAQQEDRKQTNNVKMSNVKNQCPGEKQKCLLKPPWQKLLSGALY